MSFRWGAAAHSQPHVGPEQSLRASSGPGSPVDRPPAPPGAADPLSLALIQPLLLASLSPPPSCFSDWCHSFPA